jgi:polyisoprenyl-phosphate glycosyltransferase
MTTERTDQRTEVPTIQTLSIVVPVFGCRDTLTDLVDRLSVVAGTIEHRLEILLVDDGTSDGSWSTIKSLCKSRSDIDIVGVSLSRNFGQHAAITAGLATSIGDKVAIMDCDLQDPPELIPEMLELGADYDIVLGRRHGRYQSPFRILIARMYSTVISTLAGARSDPKIGTFSLLDRKVVIELLQMPEQNRHIVYMTRWLGYHQTFLDYNRNDRPHGNSAYSLRGQWNHAINGIMFQNLRFLSIAILIGMLFAITGIGLGTYVILRRLAGGLLLGWASTMSITLFGLGALLLLQGIVGIYVGRVFEEVKARPSYVIRDIVR